MDQLAQLQSVMALAGQRNPVIDDIYDSVAVKLRSEALVIMQETGVTENSTREEWVLYGRRGKPTRKP